MSLDSQAQILRWTRMLLTQILMVMKMKMMKMIARSSLTHTSQQSSLAQVIQRSGRASRQSKKQWRVSSSLSRMKMTMSGRSTMRMTRTLALLCIQILATARKTSRSGQSASSMLARWFSRTRSSSKTLMLVKLKKLSATSLT